MNPTNSFPLPEPEAPATVGFSEAVRNAALNGVFGDDSPVVMHDSKLHLRWDSIRLERFESGIRYGIKVVYIWRGYEVASSTVDQFDFKNGNALNLSGLNGTMRLLIS